MKLLDKQELSCRNKKVESTFFCYSGSFLFVSKQQSKLHGKDKTAVFDGRHGGGRTIQDYVDINISTSPFRAVNGDSYSRCPLSVCCNR